MSVCECACVRACECVRVRARGCACQRAIPQLRWRTFARREPTSCSASSPASRSLRGTAPRPSASPTRARSSIAAAAAARCARSSVSSALCAAIRSASEPSIDAGTASARTWRACACVRAGHGGLSSRAGGHYGLYTERTWCIRMPELGRARACVRGAREDLRLTRACACQSVRGRALGVRQQVGVLELRVRDGVRHLARDRRERQSWRQRRRRRLGQRSLGQRARRARSGAGGARCQDHLGVCRQRRRCGRPRRRRRRQGPLHWRRRVAPHLRARVCAGGPWRAFLPLWGQGWALRCAGLVRQHAVCVSECVRGRVCLLCVSE